ncbi:MAG: hypothetical protein A2202_04320 [Bdellovibrionales bacterium RIFOXYA1_FULL_36_14]|nr:MAG: hypothetical protein A2202_04320 [Bdellovibrionales bacterium RIFOXYA1_FULL_36_14]
MKENKSKIQQLHERWLEHKKDVWALDVNNYLVFVDECILKAELLLAYDVLSEGIDLFPDHLQIKKSFALILNRMEMSEEAKSILMDLLQENQDDEVVLGILASAYKNLARKKPSISQPHLPDTNENLNMSIEFYKKAYAKAKNPWHGINLATLQLIIGNEEIALEIAKEVFRNLFYIAQGVTKNNYWDLATLAEALIILKDYEEAINYLRQAIELNKKDIGSQVATKKNLSLLYSYQKIPSDIYHKLTELFSIPKIVVFSGHMIDEDEKVDCRFPRWLESEVSSLIKDKIESLGDIETYSSAACGADILFIEHALQKGARVNIILPCARELFIKKSVSYLADSNWEKRFQKILASDVNLIELTSITDDHLEIPYDFANQLILGLSKMHARNLCTELIPFVVYNKDSKELDGGTASVVSDWKKQKLDIEKIELDKLLRDKNGPNDTLESPLVHTSGRYKYAGHTVSLLYADAVNYSKLSDYEMMVFGEVTLEFLNKTLKQNNYKVGEKNTWGDAFFISFYDAKDAGCCSLTMMDFMNTFNWRSVGISKNIKIRMALHVGVAYSFMNPLTGNITFNGINVCRAARMESITPPGRVFCSEEFAAFCETLSIDKFSCSYVGQKLMPKHLGKYPTYLLRRS